MSAAWTCALLASWVWLFCNRKVVSWGALADTRRSSPGLEIVADFDESLTL